MTTRARPPLKAVVAAPAEPGSGVGDGRPGRALDDRRLGRLTGYNVARTNLRMMRSFQSYVGGLGLKAAEYSALVLIASNPGVNQKQLGDALDISPPNLAVMLDQLGARGLLERVRSAVDRRLQHPRLTAAGETLLARAELSASAMEDRILDTLTMGERGILLELLKKLSG